MKYLDYTIDIRPLRPGWRWMVFDTDGLTPLGRAETATKAAAETEARACVERCRREVRS